jgi:hypothetical protein
MTDQPDRTDLDPTPLGRQAVGRLRLPGPPLDRPLPSRIGSLASGVQRFVSSLSRPVEIRRALAGPGSHEGSVAPPRWWTGAPEPAEPSTTGRPAPWLASARQVASHDLPGRQLPRATRAVPNESTYTPGGIVGGLRSEVARVRRMDEVAAAGPMLTSADRTKLNAAAVRRRQASAAVSSAPPVRPTPRASVQRTAAAAPAVPDRPGPASAAPSAPSVPPAPTPAPTPALAAPSVPTPPATAPSAPAPPPVPSVPAPAVSSSPVPPPVPSGPPVPAPSAARPRPLGPPAAVSSSPVSSAPAPAPAVVAPSVPVPSVPTPAAVAPAPSVVAPAVAAPSAVAPRPAGPLAAAPPTAGSDPARKEAVLEARVTTHAAEAAADVAQGVATAVATDVATRIADAAPSVPSVPSVPAGSPAASVAPAPAPRRSVAAVRRRASYQLRPVASRLAGSLGRSAAAVGATSAGAALRRSVEGGEEVQPASGSLLGGAPVPSHRDAWAATSGVLRRRASTTAGTAGTAASPANPGASTLRRVPRGSLPASHAAHSASHPTPGGAAVRRSPSSSSFGPGAAGGARSGSAPIGSRHPGSSTRSVGLGARLRRVAAGVLPGLGAAMPDLLASVRSSERGAGASAGSLASGFGDAMAIRASTGNLVGRLGNVDAPARLDQSVRRTTAPGSGSIGVSAGSASGGGDLPGSASPSGLHLMTPLLRRSVASPAGGQVGPADTAPRPAGLRTAASATRAAGAAGTAGATGAVGAASVAGAAGSFGTAQAGAAVGLLRAHDRRGAARAATRAISSGSAQQAPTADRLGPAAGPLRRQTADGRSLSPAGAGVPGVSGVPGVPGVSGVPGVPGAAPTGQTPSVLGAPDLVGLPPALLRRSTAPPPIPAVARAARASGAAAGGASGAPGQSLLERTAHHFAMPGQGGAASSGSGATPPGATLQRRAGAVPPAAPPPGGGGGAPSAGSVAALQAAVDQLRELVVSSGSASGGGSEQSPGSDGSSHDALVREVVEQVERRVLEELERRGRRDGRNGF